MSQDSTPTEAGIRERLADLVDANDLISAGSSRQFWNSNLFDLGLVDSMGVVYLLEMIEDEFGAALDISMLTAELTNLEAIAAYLEAG